MEKFCIVSDFDGTITDYDGLYTFISTYADGDWQKIEEDWANGKISSKECLIKEFKLVPDLSEELIADFTDNLNIDMYFKDFFDYISEKGIDFYIVSDGIDYFINRILHKYNLDDINIISNHGEFRGEFFELTFPNDSPECINNAGTCKCKIISELKKKYDRVFYIGDGVSDYCAANKADVLFAKSKLQEYCKKQNIKFSAYSNFKDIQDQINSKFLKD